MGKYKNSIMLLLGDILCVNLAYIAAFLLRFEFDVQTYIFNRYLEVYLDNLLWITLIKLLVFFAFGLYNSIWKYAGTEELIKVFIASVSALTAVMAYLYFTSQSIPRGVQGIAFLLDILFIGGTRLSYRSFRNLFQTFNFRSLITFWKSGSSDIFTRVLMVGAGDAGAGMLKEIERAKDSGKRVVAVIDDDPGKIGKKIVGKKIVGGKDYIITAAEKYGIDEIIIAIPSATKKQIQGIVNECNKTDCKVKILPAFIDLIDGKVSINNLRDVNIEDLLGRESVKVDLHSISSYLQDRAVLVTGGGGSIGSELCRQIASFHPKTLIALDVYENTVYELAQELSASYPNLSFHVAVASVRNKNRVEDIFSRYYPEVVFHAAAHKHVPLMETNPKEAVLNNILGTKNVIDLSHDYRVEKFVLISTDKAVNPTNVMGASKRVAEMLLQEKSLASSTNFSAVRFGNVLGSNGSVLPLFRRQIEQGGPVTVTHEEVTRYFMTIPEAVQLVIQAGAIAEGGEIFILDMGEPVKIMDLAENIIRMSGYVPRSDIDIKVTGLRPGEKLYEELLLEEEGIKETTHDHIFVGQPVSPSDALEEILVKGPDEIIHEINRITRKSDREVKEWLKIIVPNYVIDKSCGRTVIDTTK